MSTTIGHNSGIDTDTAAANIIAPLVEALEASAEKRETGKELSTRVNGATLAAYASCVIVVSSMIAQNIWSLKKQTKGVTSASQALKEALEVEAKRVGVSKSKVKRLVEKSNAVLVGRSKIKEVVAAANGGDGTESDVLDAFKEVGIEKETHIIQHVEGAPDSDPVTKITRSYAKLDAEDRERLLAAFREQDEADAAAEEERLAEEAAAEEAAKEEAKAAKAAKKKGPPRRKEAAVSDPFA